MRNKMLKDVYVGLILDHAAKIERAVDVGPEAVAMEFEEFIFILERHLAVTRKVAVARMLMAIDNLVPAEKRDFLDETDCGNPDCPVHGPLHQRTTAPKPDAN